jgi:hypothetical protein
MNYIEPQFDILMTKSEQFLDYFELREKYIIDESNQLLPFIGFLSVNFLNIFKNLFKFKDYKNKICLLEQLEILYLKYI